MSDDVVPFALFRIVIDHHVYFTAVPLGKNVRYAWVITAYLNDLSGARVAAEFANVFKSQPKSFSATLFKVVGDHVRRKTWKRRAFTVSPANVTRMGLDATLVAENGHLGDMVIEAEALADFRKASGKEPAPPAEEGEPAEMPPWPEATIEEGRVEPPDFDLVYERHYDLANAPHDADDDDGARDFGVERDAAPAQEEDLLESVPYADYEAPLPAGVAWLLRHVHLALYGVGLCYSERSAAERHRVLRDIVAGLDYVLGLMCDEDVSFLDELFDLPEMVSRRKEEVDQNLYRGVELAVDKLNKQLDPTTMAALKSEAGAAVVEMFKRAVTMESLVPGVRKRALTDFGFGKKFKLTATAKATRKAEADIEKDAVDKHAFSLYPPTEVTVRRNVKRDGRIVRVVHVHHVDGGTMYSPQYFLEQHLQWCYEARLLRDIAEGATVEIRSVFGGDSASVLGLAETGEMYWLRDDEGQLFQDPDDAHRTVIDLQEYVGKLDTETFGRHSNFRNECFALAYSQVFTVKTASGGAFFVHAPFDTTMGDNQGLQAIGGQSTGNCTIPCSCCCKSRWLFHLWGGGVLRSYFGNAVLFQLGVEERWLGSRSQAIDFYDNLIRFSGNCAGMPSFFGTLDLNSVLTPAEKATIVRFEKPAAEEYGQNKYNLDVCVLQKDVCDAVEARLIAANVLPAWVAGLRPGVGDLHNYGNVLKIFFQNCEQLARCINLLSGRLSYEAGAEEFSKRTCRLMEKSSCYQNMYLKHYRLFCGHYADYFELLPNFCLLLAMVLFEIGNIIYKPRRQYKTADQLQTDVDYFQALLLLVVSLLEHLGADFVLRSVYLHSLLDHGADQLAKTPFDAVSDSKIETNMAVRKRTRTTRSRFRFRERRIRLLLRYATAGRLASFRKRQSSSFGAALRAAVVTYDKNHPSGHINLILPREFLAHKSSTTHPNWLRFVKERNHFIKLDDASACIVIGPPDQHEQLIRLARQQRQARADHPPMYDPATQSRDSPELRKIKPDDPDFVFNTLTDLVVHDVRWRRAPSAGTPTGFVQVDGELVDATVVYE